MKRWSWPLLVALICLPVALLAFGTRLPWGTDAPGRAIPRSVPDGDREIAWIHTTTNASTWERFVSGVVRAQMRVPGLRVDDSAAFQDSTTAVPEIALSIDGVPGAVRIRWYKLRTDTTAADWVAALARRDPAPVAVIGGGSTDRAVDLARAMEARTEWRGDRPPLLATTATADTVAPADGGLADRPRLLDLYPGRTFRFCFSNSQMAEAVLDFVDTHPEWKPQRFADAALAAAASGLAAAVPDGRWKPNVFSVQWTDDPYSTDLHDQFQAALMRSADGDAADGPPIDFFRWDQPYSVGGFMKANAFEARTAESIARLLTELPPQRALLVLPAVTQPARRLLHAIVEAYAGARRRLVVVTGDGIPANAMLRDGDFAWPVGALGVPVVYFAHADPIAWDGPSAADRPPPPGYRFDPPNATDEAAHFGEMGRLLAAACFPPGGLVAGGDGLAAGLRNLRPAFFDRDGGRLGGSGEHVVVAVPRYRETPDSLAVWRRADGRWRPVGTVAAGGGPR